MRQLLQAIAYFLLLSISYPLHSILVLKRLNILKQNLAANHRCAARALANKHILAQIVPVPNLQQFDALQILGRRLILNVQILAD